MVYVGMLAGIVNPGSGGICMFENEKFGRVVGMPAPTKRDEIQTIQTIPSSQQPLNILS